MIGVVWMGVVLWRNARRRKKARDSAMFQTGYYS
jgi:hypothetical protein